MGTRIVSWQDAATILQVSLLEWDEHGVRVVFQNDVSHLEKGHLYRTRWKPETGVADLHIAPMGMRSSSIFATGRMHGMSYTVP